jgi:ribonuclease P protein component
VPRAASASQSAPATATNPRRFVSAGAGLEFQFFWPESFQFCHERNAKAAAAVRAVPMNRESMAGSRLRKHADYQRVYAEGKKRRSASMSWFLAAQKEPATARVGLTAGKVLGKAHERNRIKRRLRELLRRHIDQLPEGCDLILHPQRSVLTMEFSKLDAEILRILQQANAEQARANTNSSPRLGKAESAS